MDVFLDMTGTITDMESENYAIYKLAEEIKRYFSLELSAEEVLEKIEEYRKPYMDRRHESYVPIRFLILEAVKQIVPRRLCANDSYWVLDEYSRIHAKYVRLAKNALEGLQKIRNVAKHLGMITDADRPYTDKLLKSLGIEEFFDSVTTAEDVGVGKPNPKIFQEGIKNGKSEPKVYVGDNEMRDIEGAKRVGIIAIKIGHETKSADYVARDLLEAWEIIQTLAKE